jgi:DNA-directed RNA polymerase specialized sigma54-like protein
MASIQTLRPKPRASVAWKQSKHPIQPVTITKPNGEIIVIEQVKPKRVKRAKAKRSTRKVTPLTHKVSEQDNLAIQLQERREALMREIGTIHLSDK